MSKQPNESVLFHGEVYNKKDLEKNLFPIGCVFHYKNVSYNDVFTVISIKKDPGSEYRQIIGKVAGEVWMLLSGLQREVASGAIRYVQESKPLENKETKVKKDSKKKKAKSKKS